MSFLTRATQHIPTGQVGRYLVVGLWNTAFGYGTFAFLTWVLSDRIPASYLVASLVSSIFNITVSFLGYKWFVFKTTGNYLKEWVRSLAVYGGSIAVSMVLLPPMVFLLTVVTRRPSAAPYLAGAFLLIGQVLVGFLGHRNFTFAREGRPPSDGAAPVVALTKSTSSESGAVRSESTVR